VFSIDKLSVELRRFASLLTTFPKPRVFTFIHVILNQTTSMLFSIFSSETFELKTSFRFDLETFFARPNISFLVSEICILTTLFHFDIHNFFYKTKKFFRFRNGMELRKSSIL
jgi:hypothetical protein